MQPTTILLAAFATLLHRGLTAQRARDWRTPAATEVTATLAAPAATIAVGSPIALELTLTTTGPWQGHPSVRWERRNEADGSWVPFTDKVPEDSHGLPIRAAATTCLRMAVRPGVLFHLTPGTWRVQYGLSWLADDDKEHAVNTSWCEIAISAHEANQRAMRDTRMLGNPWLYVTGRSSLGEDLVVPPGLQHGLVPQGTPMADLAAAITAMRNSGVSNELAVAADLTLLRREVRRVQAMAVGKPRAGAAGVVRARLDTLAKAVPAAATPLAGQNGEVLEVQIELLHGEDPAQAAQLIAKVRSTSPMLADRLGHLMR